MQATKIVFDGSDIVLRQLVTWSREVEFIRVECAQTMTKTCMHAWEKIQQVTQQIKVGSLKLQSETKLHKE